MNKTTLLTTFLCCAATALGGDICRADEPAPKEIGVADLLKLPGLNAYKVDPYLNAAQALQAMGEDKAFELLKAFAEKDKWPYLRTVTLCRMLFRAKPKGDFRGAMIGGWEFLGSTDYEDWPLAPIAIVDGIPFLGANSAGLGGLAEPATWYVVYCAQNCDWNDFTYKPKSKEEKAKALESLLSSPNLKGKLEDDDKKFLEAEIK